MKTWTMMAAWCCAAVLIAGPARADALPAPTTFELPTAPLEPPMEASEPQIPVLHNDIGQEAAPAARGALGPNGEGTDALAEAAPPVVITLHPEVYVDGPTIVLGDLADIEGRAADALHELEVFPAPRPGNSKNLTASLIAARVRDAGYEDGRFRVKGPRIVKTTTLSQELSMAKVHDALEHYILLEMPWDPADTSMKLMVPDTHIVLPEGEVTMAWRVNPQYEYLGVGAFQGDIYVDGEREHSIMCRAEIEAYAETIIAARDIQRGQRIAMEHLETRVFPMSQLRRGTVTEASGVTGLVAKKTIMAGQTIHERHVEPPVLVKRRQLVTVEAGRGAVRVTMQAKAQEDGRAGDLIELENLESGEAFVGIVRKDGAVTLP